MEGLCPTCLGGLVFLEPDAPLPCEEDEYPQSCFAPSASGQRPARQFGRYELLEEIACGGMGIVYRARQVSLNRIVALKMILAPRMGDPGIAQRFRLEAEAAAQLQHRNIVAIHEIGEFEGQPFYTMDFVEGRSLAQLVAQRELSPRQAATCVKIIAEAIHYAHQRGILHRDLKPSNVLIDEDDQPRVTDFGLAKLMLSNSDLTLSGQTVGSPSYMAPEQAEGRTRDVSARSDVYSLGALLYEVLSGKPPFKGDSTLATLKLVVESVPAPPRLLRAGIPPDLETICLKCLEKDPARRYDSAQELADDLGHFLCGEPIQAHPVGVSERCWRWCRRNPKVAVAAGLAFLATAAGVAGISWQWRQAEANRHRAELGECNTRYHLYAADMYAAQQAFAIQNWGLVRRLLEAHRPNPGQEDLRGFEWRFLWEQVQGDQLGQLKGLSNLVTTLAFSPDSRRLVSAGRDGTLRVWNLDRRELESALPSLTGHVFRVTFSADGKQLAVGAWEGVELWDTESWQVTARLDVPMASVAFAPSNSLLAIGHSNVIWGADYTGSVWLWDTAQRATQSCLTNAGGRVAFSPDGRTLASGNHGDDIQLWDLPSGRLCGHFTNGLRLLHLEFSPDGRFLGTIQWHDGPRLGQVSGTNSLEHLGGDHSRVRALAFSPDSRTIATAGSDRTVDLWDTNTRRLRHRLRGHGEEVWAVAFSPNGKLLASAGRDDGIFLWNPSSRPSTNLLEGLFGPLGCPMFTLSPDSRRIAAATANGVQVWTVADRKPLVALNADVPLDFFPDANHLLTLCQPASLVGWNLATIQRVSQVELPAAFDRFSDARLSHSGRWIAFGSLRAELDLADVRTGQSVAAPKPHFRYVLALGFTPDDRLLVSSDRQGNAYLWEVPSLRPRGVFRGHQDYIRGLAISPDGSRLATASADGTARIWSLATCQELAILRGHSEELNDAAFSPDGRTLATTSYDKAVRLWDLRTFREMIALSNRDGLASNRDQPAERGRAQDDAFLRVRFAADGSLLIAETLWGTLRSWRAPTLQEIDAKFSVNAVRGSIGPQTSAPVAEAPDLGRPR